jgi:hypothetical protein
VELLDGTRSVPASEVFGLHGARTLGDDDRRALAAAMG